MKIRTGYTVLIAALALLCLSLAGCASAKTAEKTWSLEAGIITPALNDQAKEQYVLEKENDPDNAKSHMVAFFRSNTVSDYRKLSGQTAADVRAFIISCGGDNEDADAVLERLASSEGLCATINAQEENCTWFFIKPE